MKLARQEVDDIKEAANAIVELGLRRILSKPIKNAWDWLVRHGIIFGSWLGQKWERI